MSLLLHGRIVQKLAVCALRRFLQEEVCGANPRDLCYRKNVLGQDTMGPQSSRLFDVAKTVVQHCASSGGVGGHMRSQVTIDVPKVRAPPRPLYATLADRSFCRILSPSASP